MLMETTLPTLRKQKERYLFVFLASFITLAVIFLPILIYNKGYLLYYGDFNSQQLMFYEHVHDFVRENGFGWDWGTDLGSDIIGAYSFYVYGSPFFWLTIPFSSGAVVYLIPWLLCLKTAVAAVTSYAFIRRFVKSPDAAAIGSLLYAFSGAQIYNLFFNHFHDFTAFFPLILLGLEMRVQDNKKGYFALSVALLAIVSYFFFAETVIFTLLYFFIRCTDKNFKLTVKKFFGLATEAILGVLMSAVVFMPAALAVLANPRLSSTLSGLDMVVYGDSRRLYRILWSLFMFPDMPARANIFTADTARWASIAAYLPMFSMAGVVAYFREHKKKSWAKKLSVACLICALVPILNSAFNLFNGSYYARWFFMPVLIMALITAVAVDGKNISMQKGVKPVAIILVIFASLFMLPVINSKTGEVTVGKVAKYPDLAAIQIAGTLLLFAMLVFAVYFIPNKKTALKRLLPMTVAAVFVASAALLWYGIVQGPYQDYYIEHAIKGEIDLPKQEGEFYRIDTSENVDNWCMFWGYSSMRCFQSTVSPSIMTFYEDTMGVERNVATRAEPRYYGLRELLSVKYYLLEKNDKTEPPGNPVDGFDYIDEQNDFYIYENKYYIPMGFAYDKYVNIEDVENLSTAQKTALSVRAVFLTEEQIERYSDIMTDIGEMYSSPRADVYTEAQHKAEKSCYYFKESSRGFEAKINLEKESLVFFSVPYDEGFTAYVNGRRTPIENVFGGLSAIRVPAGDCDITFEYETVGLKEGLIISVIGLVLFIFYMMLWSRFDRDKACDGRVYDYESVSDLTDEEAEKLYCGDDLFELSAAGRENTDSSEKENEE